jgi:hypothetical protein
MIVVLLEPFPVPAIVLDVVVGIVVNVIERDIGIVGSSTQWLQNCSVYVVGSILRTGTFLSSNKKSQTFEMNGDEFTQGLPCSVKG